MQSIEATVHIWLSAMNVGLATLQLQKEKPELMPGQKIPYLFSQFTLLAFRIPKDCSDASDYDHEYFSFINSGNNSGQR